ncbi:MAG: amidohydrolase family protein, partial [Candidatus Heimdallarchaeaceae archaeon]
QEAHNADLQISFHAIGDAAVEQAVRVLKAAIKTNPREDHRHTIIHACLPTEEALKECAELGICITAQPVFLNLKEEPVEFLEEILGERHKKILPFRKMLDMGIVVSGSSDGPVSSPNPIRGIHAACNHYVPQQSITIQEALKMFTYQGAYMGFDEKERGSLEEGKIADMIILNKNPLEMKPENLLELNVEEIYLQGKKYRGKQGLWSFLARFLSGNGRKRKI